MYDLPNHMVQYMNEQVKVDFRIVSESMNGIDRVLDLAGTDEQANTYTATGRFDKGTYQLIVTRLQRTGTLPGTPTVPPEPEDTNSYLLIDETGTLLINTTDKFII